MYPGLRSSTWLQRTPGSAASVSADDCFCQSRSMCFHCETQTRNHPFLALQVDVVGFESEMESQRQRSKDSREAVDLTAQVGQLSHYLLRPTRAIISRTPLCPFICSSQCAAPCFSTSPHPHSFASVFLMCIDLFRPRAGGPGPAGRRCGPYPVHWLHSAGRQRQGCGAAGGRPPGGTGRSGCVPLRRHCGMNHMNHRRVV